MGTKEKIDKFLKDLKINPNYHVFNFNEGSQYELEDIIQRALNHFKPKSVTSEEKLKELVENTFGIDALEDKDLMYLYSECLKYAVEEITNQSGVSDKEIEKFTEENFVLSKGSKINRESKMMLADFKVGHKSGAKWMRSKLSNTVTEPPKEDCICSDEEICKTCFEEKGWIIHGTTLIKALNEKEEI